MATLVDQLGDAVPDLIVAAHRHQFMLGRVRNARFAVSNAGPLM